MSKRQEQSKVHYSSDNKTTACFIEERRNRTGSIKISTNRELINCGQCWRNLNRSTVSYVPSDTIRSIEK